MDLSRIFKKCLSDIGGEGNEDVRWYLKERPKNKNRGYPFIREANANYIVRNMGGEAIKCDRWIEKIKYHR